ncbi:MAG TPA: Mur ligase family protein [Micropepsaceae bacterium]|nr:Mur ligase family protein [Micropepsaceae bacterium]
MASKHAHIIGLGGVGMSATALLLRDMGYRITGSDAELYEPVKGLLAREGISCAHGFSAANIKGVPDLIVLGRNAKLDPAINDEVRHALSLGTRVRSFPEIIGEASQGRHVIVAAGSFGKSTTAAMMTSFLRHAGTKPGWFVGALAKNLPRTAELGHDAPFIVEGDEYPTAHGDPRPKFMHYHPRDVLLTSVVHDHVNVYPTFESYKHAFADLVALMPPDGLLVACADEPEARAMARAWSGAITYGLDEGDVRAIDIAYGAPTHFTLVRGREELGRFATSQLGRHNIENIAGVAALLLARNLISVEALAPAIAAFDGVRRRLDIIASDSSVPVIEGFGSSEEKARSAIDAMLLHFPARRLAVFFEPHTFSWRNRAALAWYDRVFAGAGHVFIAPPEQQGAATHDQLSHDEIIARVRAAGVSASALDPSHVDGALDQLKADDAVLVLTSGAMGGAIEPIAQGITARFPKRRL